MRRIIRVSGDQVICLEEVVGGKFRIAHVLIYARHGVIYGVESRVFVGNEPEVGQGGLMIAEVGIYQATVV